MTTQDETFNLSFITNLFQSARPPAAGPMRLAKRRASARETAVCLDDDPLSLRLVEHLLKKRYTVISCANMESAVNEVQGRHVDLFLCDYHLGEDFTGAQAFAQLRADFGFNPAHSILITSYPSPDIEARTKAIGFHRVFAKPLRKDFQAHCLNLRPVRCQTSLSAG